jgi:hypothetical protein
MLGKAHYKERRSLWYNNGRIKSKLNMTSRRFHHRHMIEIDDQYCEVYQAKHQGISLLLQDGTWWPTTISLSSSISSGFNSYLLWRLLTCSKKLFAKLQVELWQGSCGYLYYFGPTNGRLQKQEYLISIKGQTNWVASQIGLSLWCKAWLNCGKDK